MNGRKDKLSGDFCQPDSRGNKEGDAISLRHQETNVYYRQKKTIANENGKGKKTETGHARKTRYAKEVDRRADN